MKKNLWVVPLTTIVVVFLTLLLFNSCQKDDPVGDGKNPVFISVTDSVIEVKNDTAFVIIVCHVKNAYMINYDENTYPIHSDSLGWFHFYRLVPVNQEITVKILAVASDAQDAEVVVYNYSIFVPQISAILPPTLQISYTSSITTESGKVFTYQTMDTLYWKGGNVEVSASFTGGTLYLNGVEYFQSPAVFTWNITKTTTYNFKVIGDGGEVAADSITIPVRVLNQAESWIYESIWHSDWIEFENYTSGEITRDIPMVVTDVIFYMDGTAYAKYQSGYRFVDFSTSPDMKIFNFGGSWSAYINIKKGEMLLETTGNGNCCYRQHWIKS